MNVICEVRAPRHFGVRSASQLTFYINSLRVSASFRDFFLRIDNGYQGERSEYDNVFKFLRACEYGLPQFCAVIQEFVNLEHEGADYALFVEQLGRWFRAEVLKDLDEEGVALPISERFFHDGDSREVVVSRLREACINPGSQLSPFERRWLRDVLDD